MLTIFMQNKKYFKVNNYLHWYCSLNFQKLSNYSDRINFDPLLNEFDLSSIFNK